MDNARHIRIFEPAADDDFVSKRELAIKDLRALLLKSTTVGDLFGLASSIVGGTFVNRDLPTDLVSKIGEALKKQSPSFVVDDCTLEMRVCAALALGQAIEAGAKSEEWSAGDVLALGTWLATDFIPASQDPRLEALRGELNTIARSRVLATAIESRERKDVPDIGDFGDELITREAFKQATAPIAALRFNAALDREELDLLFWLYAGRSNLLGRPLNSLSGEARAITTGMELGAMMRRLPSQSHRNLALRDIGPGASRSLGDLLQCLGDDREPIASPIKSEAIITQAPDVFPVLSAVITGSAAGVAADQPRTLEDWVLRALLERSAITVQYSAKRRK